VSVASAAKRRYPARAARNDAQLADPLPARRMLCVLAAAKLRGERFEIAWGHGLEGVVGEWRGILITTRHEWQAAYNNEPSPGGRLREAVGP
jgi:hypothetical protein